MKKICKKIIKKTLKKESKTIFKFLGSSLITFGLGYFLSKKKQRIEVLGDLNIIKPTDGEPFSMYVSLKNESDKKIMCANNGDNVSFKINNIVIDKNQDCKTNKRD